MINAEKLTFGFGGTLLFENISFTLEENCHCALIGSNGTGKTTLTNLIREPERYIFDGKLKLVEAPDDKHLYRVECEEVTPSDGKKKKTTKKDDAPQ